VGDGPNVSERVLQGSGPVAIELIPHRFYDSGSLGDGPLKHIRRSLQHKEEYLQENRQKIVARENPIQGNSSASMMRESPILISACPTFPLGSDKHIKTLA
jgi:hypothetical protein